MMTTMIEMCSLNTNVDKIQDSRFKKVADKKSNSNGKKAVNEMIDRSLSVPHKCETPCYVYDTWYA